ncbi:hypothetical protein Franean1_2152 [Parafrankia sp. EAN1pec]|nr:hypothetical protein Franean1_2152 [Frankia sp. EAN1pec]
MAARSQPARPACLKSATFSLDDLWVLLPHLTDVIVDPVERGGNLLRLGACPRVTRWHLPVLENVRSPNYSMFVKRHLRS